MKAKRVALLLCLILGLLPVCAGAETIPVTVYRISDPVYLTDGEVVQDMTGLTLQLADGMSADGMLMMSFVDLFAHGENLASAIVQVENGALAMYLGGMTKAYGTTEQSDELRYAYGANPFEDLESWMFPKDAQAMIQQFMIDGIAFEDQTTIEVQLKDGAQEMVYIPASGDITDFVIEMVELAEADGYLGALLSDFEEGMSLSEVLRDSDFRATFEGGFGNLDGGDSAILFDYRLVIELDGEETTTSGRLVLEDFESDHSSFSVHSVEVGEGYTETTRFAGNIQPLTMKAEGTIIYDDVDEYYDSVTEIKAEYVEASGMPMEWLKISVNDVYTGAAFDMKVTMNPETDAFEVILNMDDEMLGIGFSVAYVPDEEPDAGAVSSGTFKASVDFMDFATEEISCNVSVIEAAIDTEDFYIDPADVVDLNDMSDVERNAAEAELDQILGEMVEKLEEAIPGLAGLTDMLFGLGYDEMF